MGSWDKQVKIRNAEIAKVTEFAEKENVEFFKGAHLSIPLKAFAQSTQGKEGAHRGIDESFLG
jgi:hypothetical protein